MINEQELAEAVEVVMEGGSSLGVDYDDAVEYAIQDARFIELMHQLHGATSSTQLFIVKGDYCNLLREKIAFLLTQAREQKLMDDAVAQVEVIQ